MRIAITGLKGINFQSFINEFMIQAYGTSFVPIKQKRDKGCDGIIDNRKIIAVYAPENTSLGVFKSKTKEDYDKYRQNWSAHYPVFSLIYNGEFTSDRILFLDTLNPAIEKVDINQIMAIIQGLTWPQKRNLSNYLGIDERYFIHDILKNVVEDLIQNTFTFNNDQDSIESKVPPYIVDKIHVNYDESDWEKAILEFEDVLYNLWELKSILKAYDDEEIKALKLKVITEYSKLSGDFKVKMSNLVSLFAERNRYDDLYIFYVRVVLIYLFECCIIGKKPAEAK